MKLQISCVSESTPPWFARVQNLVLSIRRFDGSLGDALINVDFIGDVPASFERSLREQGVAVNVVEPISEAGGPANKLRMFELDESADCDVLVALDCDVVVVDDFADRLSTGSIGMKPADYHRFNSRDWLRLYEMDGRTAPKSSYTATSSGDHMPPYFNSGVITVPRHLCRSLCDLWRESYQKLTGWLHQDPHLIPKHLHYFNDQIALALAVSELPHVALPVGMNFPTHAPVHPSAMTEGERISILHYHGEVDDRGFLLRPRSEEAVGPADAFNMFRATQLSLPYSGLRSRTGLERLRASMHEPRRMLARRHRVRTWIRDAGMRHGSGSVRGEISERANER
ncbi:MAG TPA: hypothetical protein VIM28_06950 [Solirubrobacterales bacterium]